ncbi:MAG: GxxExxY protein [Thiobacillus sp.]|nr:GxxExxY protein [Thiobacillus sp.]
MDREAKEVREENLARLGEAIIGGAMRVHSALGPGLLESAYEVCLCHELSKTGLRVARQVALPIRYDGIELEAGYRLDLVVENSVVLELKSVEKILPVHIAQVVSYLNLGGYSVGYLLNFNVSHMRDGIRRLSNKRNNPLVPPLPPC